MFTRYAAWLSGALLVVASIGVAHAEYVDPPGRVARLSYTRGDVSFSPGGESDWVNATRNRPLIRGDRLWAGRGALAELQAGNATFRVDEGTSLSIVNLNDDTAQVEITQGTLNLRVRRIYEGQIFEVDTPTLAFVVSRPGEYRIDVDARDNHTTIAVWDGGGEAYGDKANFRIREGEAIRFYDTRLTDYEAFDIPRPDDFDRFCMDRDSAADRSASRRYVSEDLIGYSDLDEYGSWSTESDYGAVWYPTRVASDWAPYRDGHWIWQEPWGWTWVDDSPWGFAPFHYGRWAYVRNRWGWIPGPIASRPVYAPALVAFVGGHNWSVGINVGRPIGWFPLGPREIYVPSYRTSRNYFTRVNVSNTVINNTYITNIYNDYSNGRNVTSQVNYFNRGVNGAVTAVSTDTFVNSRGVRGAQVRFDREMAMRGETSQVASIAPVNRSVLGAGRTAANVPQRDVFDRAVVARTAPPRDVVSFADRQQALQRTPGRALTPDAIESLQTRGGRSAAGANVPQRVRVIDDNAARNARTLDAEQGGGRGSSPSRSRGPDDAANPGRTVGRDDAPRRDAPNREAPSRDVAPGRDVPSRDASPNREAPNRDAPVRGRDTQPAERDFTRPDVRERVEPSVRREPIRDAPNPRETIQRDAPSVREVPQRDESPRGRGDAQREQIQRDRDQSQREQVQRDREQSQREQVQRDREQSQREQVQRDREQSQREQVQRDREQSQREQVQRDREQSQREQVQRDREQSQREQQARSEQFQRDREQQQAQREQQQQMQREQAQQREQQQQMQREQAQQREQQQQMQREQAQQREQQQQMQREQAQQREQQQQMQREQAQQREQQQQVQREQAQQVQRQREQAPPRENRRDAPPPRERGSADGDERKSRERDERAR
jgi:hypothetical protein